MACGTIQDRPYRFFKVIWFFDALFRSINCRTFFLKMQNFYREPQGISPRPNNNTPIPCRPCSPPVKLIRQNDRLSEQRRLRHIDMPAQSKRHEEKKHIPHSTAKRPNPVRPQLISSVEQMMPLDLLPERFIYLFTVLSGNEVKVTRYNT
jgi:hypothetical protein